MTVHEFLTMFVSSVENVDMGDTPIRICTPDGEYAPYTIRWEDETGLTREGLVIDVLATESFSLDIS